MRRMYSIEQCIHFFNNSKEGKLLSTPSASPMNSQIVYAAITPGLRNLAKAIIANELIELAKNKSIDYYKPVVDRVNAKLLNTPGIIKLQFRDIHLNHPNCFIELLAEVTTALYNEGLGMLSSVIIRQEEGNKTEMPGSGYFLLCRELGMKFKNDETDKLTIWCKNLSEVHNLWSAAK